jgi:hypothetical protein
MHRFPYHRQLQQLLDLGKCHVVEQTVLMLTPQLARRTSSLTLDGS